MLVLLFIVTALALVTMAIWLHYGFLLYENHTYNTIRPPHPRPVPGVEDLVKNLLDKL